MVLLDFIVPPVSGRCARSSVDGSEPRKPAFGTVIGMRLATFNVCGLPNALPPVEERAPEFCRRLEALDLDLVLFQEVWWKRQFALLKAHLPTYRHVAWRWGAGGRPAGGVVTFSRLPLGSVAYRSFRGARPVRGGARFRARRAVYAWLQGVLTVPVPSAGVLVANTHLTANLDDDWSTGNRYQEFQQAEVRILHRQVRRVRTPDTPCAVIGGDFNIASTSPLYAGITEDGTWRDPFAQPNPPTYHGAFLGPGATGWRLDYLLVNGGTAAGAERLFTDPVTLPDGRRTFLSDHMALAATVEPG
jgi:exonuclease III